MRALEARQLWDSKAGSEINTPASCQRGSSSPPNRTQRTQSNKTHQGSPAQAGVPPAPGPGGDKGSQGCPRGQRRGGLCGARLSAPLPRSPA